MRMMLVRKNTALVNVVILCLFVFFVGVIGATESSTSEVTPLSLKTDSGNETECDCGPHGECELDKEGNKKCFCKPRFQDNNGLCEECDCGENGICSFNQSVKTCRCQPQYGDKDGICTECSCFLPFSGGIKIGMRCTFENGVEKCKCPKGYKQENTTCLDIDECLDSTACPNGTNCMNAPGDYICLCKPGFKEIKGDARRYGCSDLSDCEYDGCSHNESTSCVKSQGGSYCQCKPGYSLKYGTNYSIKVLGCEKDGLATGYIILITVAVIVVVAAVVIVVKNRCLRSVRNPGYRTGI